MGRIVWRKPEGFACRLHVLVSLAQVLVVSIDLLLHLPVADARAGVAAGRAWQNISDGARDDTPEGVVSGVPCCVPANEAFR